MKVLGVDPGGKTGICLLDTDTRSVIYYDEIPAEDMWDFLHETFNHMTIDLVAMERYFITPRTIQYTRQPDALYIIGAVKYLCHHAEIPLKMQSASDAKNAFPNDRLKQIDMFKSVTGGHARDALRHALLASIKELR